MARQPRRFWSDDEKRRIVAETRMSGVSVSAIARRYRMNANLLFTWLRDPRFAPPEESPQLVPVDVIEEAPEVEEHPAANVAAGRVEIELPGGARLRCAVDIDLALLTRLLSALARAS